MTLIGLFCAALASGFVAGLINLFVNCLSEEIEVGIWWGMLVWAIATTAIFIAGLHYRDVEYNIVSAILLISSVDIVFVSTAFLLKRYFAKH